METLNIKDMSVEQLKSMAYDTLAIIEQNQRNLQLLNQEIGKKELYHLSEKEKLRIGEKIKEKPDEPKIKKENN